MRRRFTFDSMMRGHHVYQEVWTPDIGEYLDCARETENPQDRYAVAVFKARYSCQPFAKSDIHCLLAVC